MLREYSFFCTKKKNNLIYSELFTFGGKRAHERNLRNKRRLFLGQACVCIVILSKMAEDVTRVRRMVE